MSVEQIDKLLIEEDIVGRIKSLRLGWLSYAELIERHRAPKLVMWAG